jgi:hypothetical protein
VGTNGRVVRGLGIALVSAFLIVGAVFAADALSHPGSAGGQLPTPAAAQTAQPTPTVETPDTPEPVETSELTETAQTTRTYDTADSDPGKARGGDDLGSAD